MICLLSHRRNHVATPEHICGGDLLSFANCFHSSSVRLRFAIEQACFCHDGIEIVHKVKIPLLGVLTETPKEARLCPSGLKARALFKRPSSLNVWTRASGGCARSHTIKLNSVSDEP